RAIARTMSLSSHVRAAGRRHRDALHLLLMRLLVWQRVDPAAYVPDLLGGLLDTHALPADAIRPNLGRCHRQQRPANLSELLKQLLLECASLHHEADTSLQMIGWAGQSS